MNDIQIFDLLPDLLKMAIEEDANDRYRIQDKLREEYKSKSLAFRWSMPLRHFSRCSKCKQRFTEVIYTLENPELKTLVNTRLSHIHAVKEHGAEMDAKLHAFLMEIA